MRNIQSWNIYNNHTLNYTNKYNQGYYVEILQAIESLFNNMIQRHNKVLFATFVLKYPANTASQYPDNNVLLSRFIEALVRYYHRHNHDPKYLWVRERSSTDQIHYHVMILLNANSIQKADGIIEYAIAQWQRCLGIDNGRGFVGRCPAWSSDDRCGAVVIRRNDPYFQQVYGQCFQRASYLGKCYSKGNAPANVNEYGHSRLS